MLLRRTISLLVVAVSVALVPAVTSRADVPDVLPNRDAEPVVLTGAQVPDWSRLAATGTPNPYPSGASEGIDDTRDAHNGTIVVPPDARAGVPVEQIVAHRWDGAALVEIPVQVDQRFPYFLANANSDFGVYSGTDTELTYQWDRERWNMTSGECMQDDTAAPTVDPVPTLDDDDELVFMASDAGAQAPAGVGPAGSKEIAVADPLRGTVGYVYLSLSASGPGIAGGYVSYVRDANANEWIDRNSFAPGSTEQLGSSNGGYGPNLSGTVCDPDPVDPTLPPTVRDSTDRFPRDGVTVTTGKYQWHASGRWMVRSMRVASPRSATPPTLPPQAKGKAKGHAKSAATETTYGPDLIDRWKGRAFQSSPDSSISVVGFEDEQVNWEANSSLLGERVGPVRAIRETWGADSGTNVTKTETFYRDAVTYRYRMRVHPIPPDGLYTSWDYNAGIATTYFNALHPDGVAIDGVNDDVGQVDSIGDMPAFFDAPDPTFSTPITMLQWEQVSGRDDFGSLVYVLENKGATSLENPAVVPYYRDDKCFDDGTGDDPVARPWPGEASTDPRVVAAYAGADCDHRQGAWGEHGVHYFFTGDTDNAFVGSPTPVDEVDAQQWQFAVPTSSPVAVGEPYAQDVRVPLVATVTSLG